METKWKKQLVTFGILCSLLTCCLSGCGAAVERQTTENVDASALLPRLQKTAFADRTSIQRESVGGMNRGNAPAQTEIYLDDEAAVYSNGWAANTTDQIDERFGDRFAYAGGVGSGAVPNAVARWEPIVIERAGRYQIDARWTAHANRAPNVPFTLEWGDQSVTVRVNQQINGGSWNLLQTIDLKAGDALTISLANNADGYVIADGIRIVLIEPAPEDRYTVTVDYDAEGGSVEGKLSGLLSGEQTILTAKPKAGWQFAGWYSGDKPISIEPECTLTVTENLTLTARFERIPVEKSRLEGVLELARRAEEDGLYDSAIPSVKRDFEQLTEAAERLLGDAEAIQEDVDRAADRLEEFLGQPIPKAADKGELEAVVARAEKAEEDGLYKTAIPSVRQEFAGLLSDARELLAEEDALQEPVDEICRRLTDFLSSPIAQDTDKSGLKMVLEYGEGLDPDAFVPAGRQEFVDALRVARAVYDRVDADQETVDDAMAELLDRTADLRILPEG